MQLENIAGIKPSRITNGKPSSALTNKEWQEQFQIMKLYITPHKKSVSRMRGKFQRESGKQYADKQYDGITNRQSYCSFINDILKNIKAGSHDYCYFGYQIIDLLKFNYNNLRTKYHDGYWEVWLEQ